MYICKNLELNMEENITEVTKIADIVFEGLAKIKSLEGAKQLIETSNILLFSTPERNGNEIVTLENSEETAPIIEVAKQLALKYIENKISSLQEVVYPHIVP